MGKAWRLLRSGYGSGHFNMALDKYLLYHMRSEQAGAVLRFYRWKPAAVSCGFGQVVEQEVDLAKCQQAGIDVVLRPTGGRAVLHWDELTYSVVWPLNEPGLNGTISETYQRISSSLARGLKIFGLTTEIEKTQSMSERPRTAGLPCFSSTARWELKYRGRKLVGSAQRRIGQAVLQHGSLLLGPQHLYLAELLPEGKAAQGRAYSRDLEQRSTYLRQCIDNQVNVDMLEDCLAEGFRQELGIDLQMDDLKLHEIQAVEDGIQRCDKITPDSTITGNAASTHASAAGGGYA